MNIFRYHQPLNLEISLHYPMGLFRPLASELVSVSYRPKNCGSQLRLASIENSLLQSTGELTINAPTSHKFTTLHS